MNNMERDINYLINDKFSIVILNNKKNWSYI